MSNLEGLHVLLVDDDEDARETLTAVLASLGIRSTAASTAADARLILRYVRPDAIVSDLCMPEENGFQFIAGIRREEQSLGVHVPAVAISAYLEPNDQQLALRAGFDAFVRKPFDVADLSSALGDVLARSAARRPAVPQRLE
jgi:CheY-like chemotaxis protein